MDEGLLRSYFKVVQDAFCRGHEYPANSEVGDGLIKILNSQNFTTIGARASSNELSRQYDVDDGIWKEKEFEPFKVAAYRRHVHPAYKSILEQLEKPVPKETGGEAIKSAKILRTNIKRLPENWRHKLVDSLQQGHVSTMWEIAGNNSIDCAADMVPTVERTPPVRVKEKPHVWKGKIHRIFWNLRSTRMDYIFGNDSFKMRFSLDNNGSVYGEIIRGKKGLYYLIRKEDAIGDPLHKKPLDLTFEYRNGDQQLAESPIRKIRKIAAKIGKIFDRRKNRVGPSDGNVERGNVDPAEHRKQFMDKHFSIRCAGPNVLVGQARSEHGFKSGEFVLIKKC